MSADSPLRIPPHQRFTLQNGLRLVLLPRHEVPLIAFEVVVRGGARLDAPEDAGAAALMAELLTRGAGPRDAFAFADAVEGAGGSFETEARSEALFFHGQFLARDCQLMLELLADALQRPRFDVEELSKLQERRIEFIKAAKDADPQSLISAYGRALLFADHPYGKPVGGSETTLATLDRERILYCYREQISADRVTLVFAGDFDARWLRELVTQAFEHWTDANAALPALPVPNRVRGRRVLLVDAPDPSQTYFWIGNVGVARAYPHRAALDITNTAFGGSFGSMLVQALRVKSGLTYSASSGFRRGSVAGEFSINSFAQTSSISEALTLTLETLAGLKREGIEPEALDSARNYILGQYPLGFETAADWASALAELDLYGMPDSEIAQYGPALGAVGAAESRQVVAEAFPPSEDVDIVLIGDAAVIREQAKRLGPVREKPLEAPDFSVLG